MAETREKTKIKLGSYTTDFLVSVWPKLNTPDAKFNKFGTDLHIPDEKVEGVREKLTKFRDQAFAEFQKIAPTKTAKKLTLGAIPLKAEEDKEGDPTGRTLLRTGRKASGEKKDGTTWKAKIVFKDAKGEVVPANKVPQIWGGSVIRIATTVFGYYMPTEKQVGVTLEIDGVQIKKLVEGGRDTSSLGAVEDEDGWTSGDNDFGYKADDSSSDDSTDTGEDTPNF